MRRGDILLAELGDPVGHEQGLLRPVLVVSAPPWLASTPPVVAVLPITRTNRHSPTHVELEAGASGLRDTSYVKCEDIRAISPRRITRRFGRADGATMSHIDLILRRLLSL